MIKYKQIQILLLFLLISGCQPKSGPTITHIVLKNNVKGTILDTDKKALLKAFEKDFYDKDEFPEGDPTFEYLLDITSEGKSTRWQYNPDGKIRIFDNSSKIYKINNLTSFNKTLTIH